MMKNILFEDSDIIVVYKPAGIATQTARVGQQDMVSEIKNYLAKKENKKGEPYLGIIHRLDQPVSGVLVFARNKQAAASLSAQLAEGDFCKRYYALICGEPDSDRGELTDFLYKDGRENRTIVVKESFPDAKKASLRYEKKMTLMILETGREVSLMEILLLTGRHHQIRVQMANAGMPLIGDTKYGGEESRQLSKEIGCRNVALSAYRLEFLHPITGEKLIFEEPPKEEIFQPFLGYK